MIAEEFVQNIEMKTHEIAIEHTKKEIITATKKLTCQKCNSNSYSITGFSNDHNSIIAHLKCDNCGFEGEFTGNYSIDMEDAKKSITIGIHDLQKTIEDINRKINK